MELATQRIVFVALAASALAVALRRHRQVRGILWEFATEPGYALDLAILRILVFGALVAMPPDFELFAAASATLRAPLPWTGAFYDWIPFDPTVFSATRIVFFVAAICALIGFASRPAAALAVLTGLYLYGVPQFFGKVIQYHHLLWFGALCAVSPSGDQLSVDALLWRRKTTKEPSVAFGLPLKTTWVLLSLAYVFPGLWKLWRVGYHWASADNVRHTLWRLWAERPDFVPAFRIDRWPLIAMLGGAAALVFEVGFPFLLFHRRTRLIAATGAILFHIGNGLVSGILLWPLLIMHLSFVPWARWLQGRRLESSRPFPSEPAPRAVLAVASLLIVGAVATGATHTYSWPFSCYPTFARLEKGHGVSYELEVQREGSAYRRVDLSAWIARLDAARWTMKMERTSALPENERLPVLRALFDAALLEDPSLSDVRSVRFYEVRRSLDPERRAEELRRSVLGEFQR